MRKLLQILLGIIAVIAIVAAGVYLFFVSRSQPMPDHPFFRPDDPLLVIAHRGGAGERPENTMLAFQHAVDVGVDALEMDVHSTSDGVLVVIHDDTVDRTTDGSGRVHDMTFAELQALDAGYNWTPADAEAESAGHPFRGSDAKIPAFEEVLTAFPDMRMVIEIKQETPSIVQPLCDMLRAHHMQEQVIVGSFHAAALYAFRDACPEVATSAAEEEIRPFFILNQVGLTRAYAPSMHAFQVPEYSGSLHVVTQSFVEGARAHNIAVQTWTINDEADMRRMIDLDVNGIITDFPTRLMDVLGRETPEQPN